MSKYSYELHIAAANEQEAETKMRAVTVLASKLSAKELEQLAHIVKNDPVKMAIARKALGV
mgnify:CR=1 FL=1|jgi:hypothetical protein